MGMSRVVHSNKNRTDRKGSDRKNTFSTNNSVEESDSEPVTVNKKKIEQKPKQRNLRKNPDEHTSSGRDILPPIISLSPAKDKKQLSQTKTIFLQNWVSPKRKRRQSKEQKNKIAKKLKKGDKVEKEPSIEEHISTLPATVLSPSVLASIVINEQKHGNYQEQQQEFSKVPSSAVVREDITLTAAGKSRKMQKDRKHYIHESKVDNTVGDINNNMETEVVLSPQHTFDKILKQRGYNNSYSIDAEETEYDAAPSSLQLASYGTYYVWAVQTSNAELLSKLLACGLSANPCNQFRDSILGDLVCKKDNVIIYRCLVNKFNADLQVVDGFGRTPLHHCCWSHNLCKEIVTDILYKDPIQIFINDKNGNTPLEYVRADQYEVWNNFLHEVADTYWPIGGQLPSLFSPKDRRPSGDMVDPPNALIPMLAADVSSGTITPEVALFKCEKDI